MIQKQFNAVLEHSQEVTGIETDELFRKWKEAKKYFIDLFGGKLIYECPEKVSFELDDEIKSQKYNNFIEYISGLGVEPAFYHFFYDYNWKDFYNNSLSHPHTLPSGQVIPAGTKFVKSFKYFIKEKVLLNDLQSKASELIQENKVSGTLCFSVHPLDFLSLSENNYHWRSCHSLDGEYRAGNLSYMVDSTTMICYLKGPGEVQLKQFPEGLLWNNKKWRCLFFISKQRNAVFAGRQYPFFTSGGLEKMRECFLNLTTDDKRDWSPWYNEYIGGYEYKDGRIAEFPENCYAPINHQLHDLRNIIINLPGSRMFNDLLESSCYVPYYMFKDCWNYKVSFPIGGETKCIHCGEKDITIGDTMLCTNCLEEFGNVEFSYCECCGARIYEGEQYYVQGEVYCEDCYNEHTFQCGRCGYQEFNYNKHWSEEDKCFICQCCFEEEELDG